MCLKLLLEPVTLSCGHTFCRACLVRAVERDHHCPMCRAPTFVTPRDTPPNFVVAKLIQKLYPNDYAARLQEEKEDVAEEATVHVPLFLYPSPPFPGEPVELAFFEQRYLHLATQALQGSRKFGYQESETSGACCALFGWVALAASRLFASLSSVPAHQKSASWLT